MPLVGSFIMPHGALTLSKTEPSVPTSAYKLHDACMTAAKQINDLHPDYIFLTTPHGVSLSEDYVIYANAKASGSAEWADQWGEYKVNVNIAQDTSADVCEYLNTCFKDTKQDVRFQMLTAYAPSEKIMLRWGEAIPIWFIQQQRDKNAKEPEYIFFSMPRKRLNNQREVEMIPELFQIGKNLRDFFAEMQERVVVVISADLAHTHNHSVPGHPTPFGLNEHAEVMDSTLEKWARTLDVSLLHVEAAKYVSTYVCGFTGFCTLSGIISAHEWTPQFLARDHPTYYGMMVAAFHPNKAIPYDPAQQRKKEKKVEEYPIIG